MKNDAADYRKEGGRKRPMKEKAVGIVANPASGKDIRRIVTYSTPYGNQEKVNIIRRVLMALHATGIHKVYYMPEYYNIVPQAANGIYDEHKNIISDMVFEPLDFMVLEKESDMIKAGQMMQALDVDCVITLGGDGTNRAFAKYAGTLPIVPVSTGTPSISSRYRRQKTENTMANTCEARIQGQIFNPSANCFAENLKV